VHALGTPLANEFGLYGQGFFLFEEIPSFL